MTTSQTYQTLLTHSISSADYVRQRAQPFAPRADNAPGFAGVLEAFSQPLEESEPLDDLKSIDEADDSESEDTEESQKSSKDEAQAAQENDSADQSDAEDIKLKQNADASNTINSIHDLESLLSNAASVNLAGLATQQLKSEPPQQPSGAPNPNTKNDVNAEQGKNGFDSAPAKQSPGYDGGKIAVEIERPFGQLSAGLNQNQGASAGQGNDARDMLNTSHSQVSKAQGMPIDPAIQTPPIAPRPVENHQSAEPAKFIAAQAVQAQASNLMAEARRLQTIRSIAEMPVSDSKPKEITGSESAGKQGAQDSGLDLGNKSQNIAKLLQSNPADDRAMQRQQVLAQVQRGLASILNTKGGTMKIRLSPEHLGEVNIQLTTKDGRISVQIQAKNESTRSMLSEGLEGLRSAIEARGAIVDELNVDGQQQTKFERLFGQQDGSNQPGDSRQSGSQHPDSSDQDGRGGQQEQSEIDIQEQLSNQPRGIWTELGLDAIA